MKKFINKLLLTLLLAISICNTGTANYNTTSLNPTDEYEIELHFFDDNDDSDIPCFF